MAEEIVACATHFVFDPTCRNGERAYDGSLLTDSRHLENAIGGAAFQRFGPFTITTPVSQRGVLEIDVSGQWATADIFDKTIIFASTLPTGAWTVVDDQNAQAEWTPAAGGPLVTRTFDISAIVGSSNVFYLAVMFYNGFDGGTPPNPDGY